MGTHGSTWRGVLFLGMALLFLTACSSVPPWTPPAPTDRPTPEVTATPESTPTLEVTETPGETPVATFSFTGAIEDMSDGSWIVAATQFAVNGDTEIDPGLSIGQWVRVQGVVLTDRSRLATRIELLEEGEAFDFTGRVGSIEPDSWQIAGETVQVSAKTQIDDGVEVGNLVHVEGLALRDGTKLAQSISLVEDAQPFQFDGTVEKIGEDSWDVSGQTVSVNADTEIGEGLEVGSPVSVTGVILPDGTWLAESIVAAEKAETFSFHGRVESMDEKTWQVSGQIVAVDDGTEISEGIDVGSLVLVEGVVLADGTWLAERIDLANRDEAFDFTGTVESIGDESWQVSGHTMVVNADTDIAEGLDVGARVYVSGVILTDGTWLAETIEPANEENGGNSVDQEATGTPEPTQMAPDATPAP